MSSPPREQLVTHSPSPIRRRSSTSSPGDGVNAESRRLSPTLVRSYDLNDPQVRERQRTMDVDMAMQLSRARRDTQSVSPVDITRPHNSHTHSYDTPDSLEPHTEGLIGFAHVLSPNEQHEIDIARGEAQSTPFVLTPTQSSSDLTAMHSPTTAEVDRLETVANLHALHHDHGHDPDLLVSQARPPTYPSYSHNNVQPSSSPPPPVFGALPKYQAHIPERSLVNATFDFGPMETFAAAEKTLLGLSTPAPLARLNFKAPAPPLPLQQSPLPEHNNEQPNLGTAENAVVDAADSNVAEGSSTPRMRQRKLSQSNPSPRVRTGNTRATKKGKGKMALFEAGESQGMSLPGFSFGIGALGESFLNGHGDNGNANAGDTYAYAGNSGAGILNTGHDRPYRFSFYSNALSATIHARSLSELPAEGQTFEQLFGGEFAQTASGADEKRPHGSEAGNAGQRSSYFASRAPPVETIRQAGSRPTSGPINLPKANSNALTGGMIGSALANTDVESMTWWLDIQSPTDDEMKMLSKVFTIHPLTTEDIQMEETREKIELFRTYYLVCFRSFDQDPYSPTHLEPLNMYIIVFREGILSFHFRPTPHPQNVRRRINQLKDYISVTSDWISYALIDDITDAFGPLIQGIEYEVDSIDELVLILKEAETTDMLRRIGTCRKKVMGLLRLMGNKADVVKGLAKRCNENWRVAPTSDIGLYLSDIQDHLITMTQNLNHYEKILSRSHSNYLAQISIEMTDANNQINDVLSKLTALGTVLIPMNLVTGLWGMNVHVPGEETEGLKWFASIIACLAAFALIGGYSTYKFMVRR